MGTWISHLRTAESIARSLPELNFDWFIAGSIAPDCGMPDETWTHFDPPKSVTHYLAAGDGKYTIRDLDFYREYHQAISPDLSDQENSFLWGYYFHLLTDRLWVDRIDPTTKTEWADLFASKGKTEAIDLVKADWYDLDHRFLRDHPGWQPWIRFSGLTLTMFPIHHISPKAILFQFDYIRRYYTEEGAHRNLDRPYQYMNEHTMQRITNDAAAASLQVFRLLQEPVDLTGLSSAVELLPPEERSPYPPPLGDG